MLHPFIISTSNQKVLSLLVKFSDRELYEREVARSLGISAGSANRTLNELFTAGVARRRKEGKMYFYSIDISNTVIKQFKKIINLMLIEPLTADLKKISNRIILYGSCAQGTDTSASDMDLFVVTNNKEDVSNIIINFHFPRGYENIQIQPVIKTHVELLEAGDSERSFIEEVEQGIVLWEKVDNESRV